MFDWLSTNGIDVLIGLAVCSAVAGFAYQKRSLSQSGLLAALVVGTVIFVTGGWYFLAVLLVFFISSSLLSKLSKKETKEDALRTYKQVLANAGIAMVLSIFYGITEDEVFRILYTISFAVSTADTWASEIGKLSKADPRHILSWKRVEQGLSGGITRLGTAASLLGSLFMSVFAMFNLHVIVFGFLGSIVDSLLGTAQIKYVTADGRVLDAPCPVDGYTTTTGWKYLSNNLVNFFSNLIIVVGAYYAITFM
jgi:uncharacterized protein (TIGR00297 family)